MLIFTRYVILMFEDCSFLKSWIGARDSLISLHTNKTQNICKEIPVFFLCFLFFASTTAIYLGVLLRVCVWFCLYVCVCCCSMLFFTFILLFFFFCFLLSRCGTFQPKNPFLFLSWRPATVNYRFHPCFFLAKLSFLPFRVPNRAVPGCCWLLLQLFFPPSSSPSLKQHAFTLLLLFDL